MGKITTSYQSLLYTNYCLHSISPSPCPWNEAYGSRDGVNNVYLGRKGEAPNSICESISPDGICQIDNVAPTGL